MSQLFAIIFKYRVFLVFIFLELVAAGLIVNNNSYQRSVVLSSSNTLVGGIYSTSSNVEQYFHLTSVNEDLLNENALLRKQIELNQVANISEDSVSDDNQKLSSLFYGMSDTVAYDFIPARVINNSIYRSANYITLNKGRKDGIVEGMGLMTKDGVVGQVKSVSNHFSTCYSLLHRDMAISSELKKNGALCTVKWDTEDPTTASANYLPLHLDINVGDTITTSGFNTVYPEGVMLGVVTEAERTASERFWIVKIDVAVDFSKLHHVYVSKSLFRAEKDSLEALEDQ